ncbi:FAD-binding and (Fe-S)-binding domain-containing protein [Marihabitans asiaticum]|uniref:FAD/FMN-containing dehydrogenase n=1 Tax=Marihabitans asiaticum TaxID=415218 RepID=A0A560W9W3_9MICO|nr:FAD-binding and (Fe-S)-binding domain-containing protein [Marihabitans asiaticum]TWD14411.1 FAD/FMN-containing dehydrogenase [Marihabitans asiaticum]
MSATDLGQELAEQLRRAGVGDVRTDPLSIGLYAADASIYRIPPRAVVLPRDTDEIAATLAVARERGVPITPRGAGTSCAGNAIGPGIVLDTSRYLGRVLEVDAESQSALVEPGTVHADLQRVARAAGLRFGPDPSSHTRCTIGGMIGNNACGNRALGYGRTSDNVMAMDLLLADGRELSTTTGVRGGEASVRGADDLRDALHGLTQANLGVIRTELGRFGRQVSGYALEHLLPENGRDIGRMLVGSEGTLAVVTRARVRLVTEPPATRLVALGFADIYAAGDVAHLLRDLGAVAAEGIDRRIVDVVRSRRGPSHVPDLPKGDAWLFVEITGADEAEADDAARRVIAEVAALDARVVTDVREVRELWRIREDGAGLAGRSPRDRPAHAGWEDAAVPPSRMGDYLRDLDALLLEHDVTGLPYGHFGDGCLHIRLDVDLASPGAAQRYRELVEDAADLVAAYGGSLSGEHGDGRARSALLPRMYSQEALSLFAQVKHAFDPANLLGPGVLVDPDPVEASLRIPRARSVTRASTDLAFAYPEDDGDLTQALHRCTGVGKCRAAGTATTVMCPSYLATREEKDSTRGRARILQEMLDGGTITGGWADPAVHEALDLCLSCKGCASDCPTGIDMATYKSEVLHQTYRGRRRPVTHYSLGRLPQLARIASRAPRLVNALTGLPGVKRLTLPLAGVDPRRTLPTFAQQTFRSWAHGEGVVRPAAEMAGTAGAVAIFVDSFVDHFTPHVGRAAVAVLREAGFTPFVPAEQGCCGLTLVSTGQLDAARESLEGVTGALLPVVAAGIPVVGLEPSCTATLRHDLPRLIDSADAARVAAGVRTVAELLTEAVDAGRWDPPDLTGVEVVAQPHCHHHAVMTWAADEELLERTGASVRRLGGCCGLAGNFGVERGHYEVSVEVARQQLLPAIEEAAPDAVLLADGFSCQTQVADLTERAAVHLVELLSSSPRP